MRIILNIFIIGISTAIHLSAGGFATLKMGTDARMAGMGLSGTALENGASSPFCNPALTGEHRGRELTLSLHRWMDDVQSEFIGFAAGNGRQGMGAYVLFTNMGDLRHSLIPSENPLGYFSAHEMALSLSFGIQLFSAFRMGISVKGYYEKIYYADTWGMGSDIGILWQPAFYNLRLGFVLQNMGKTGHLQNESIPLPFTARFGLAWPINGMGGQWSLCMDAVKEEGFPGHIHTGAEFVWHSVIALRMGYQTGYENRDVTGGIGIIRNNLRLDYGYMPMTILGDSHRLSLCIGW